MDSLEIQAFTYQERYGVLPGLTTALGNCGGWVIERNTLSATATEFQLEIQLRSVVDLYGAIAAAGIELTRAGHDVLTELCMRRKHLRRTTELGQVLKIRLEINFFEDLTLHSLLSSNAGAA